MINKAELSTIKERAADTRWVWIAAALIAQTSWGAYPVIARYLQTVSQLPSFSLLVVGNLGPLLILTIAFRHKIQWKIFQSKLLWGFTLIVVVRAITNMLAARYTLSIYVQLITQMTPFLVVLLSATFFKEKLPRFTWWAITFCLIGALLMMGNDMGQISTAAAGERNDWLGMALAFASSLSLALYMIVVRHTAGDELNVPAEVVVIVQMIAIVLFNTVVSVLIGEEWQRWAEMSGFDWFMFFCLSFGVFLIANTTQVGAIRHIGAPLVSSVMAWRLVSALILGALVLGERLESWWQLLGAAVVLVTITWYLSSQRTQTAS